MNRDHERRRTDNGNQTWFKGLQLDASVLTGLCACMQYLPYKVVEKDVPTLKGSTLYLFALNLKFSFNGHILIAFLAEFKFFVLKKYLD